MKNMIQTEYINECRNINSNIFKPEMRLKMDVLRWILHRVHYCWGKDARELCAIETTRYVMCNV
jgi:hypothetical protein